MTTILHYTAPLGRLTLAEADGSIIGLWLAGQKYEGSTLHGPIAEGETPALAAAGAWLDRYFAGACPTAAELTLAPEGTAFRRAVWAMLCKIPYGTLTTYGALARALAAQTGRAVSARSVGGAVGHNPIALIIPCHRVVGADGSLTGYAGGLAAKTALLRQEGIALSGQTAVLPPKLGTPTQSPRTPQRPGALLTVRQAGNAARLER